MRYLRRLGRRLGLQPAFYGLLWFVDRLVPKQYRAVVCTLPDFDDQGLAVVDAVQRGYRVTWLTHGQSPRRPGYPPGRVVFLSRWSIRGHWHYLRSNLVLYTHGLYGFAKPVPGKVVVNLWHGMPVKQIGIPDGQPAMSANFSVATCPTFRDVLMRAWAVPSERILVTGLPRNDRLIRAARTSQRTAGNGSPTEIAWLPTYRRSLTGEVRVDGVADRTRPGGLRGFESVRFEQALYALDMTCTLKTHPMATVADFPPSTQHLAICSDADLDARGLTLYDMLGATDALVTDVSSVWVDYLLLDKPIIFAFGDLEEFRDSRGYTLDPILEWLPGPVVTTMRERSSVSNRLPRVGTTSGPSASG